MILASEQLEELTGYKRPADIEKCLKSQGITVFKGKDGKPFLLPNDYQSTGNDGNLGGSIEFED